jgi:hypothetical protein
VSDVTAARALTTVFLLIAAGLALALQAQAPGRTWIAGDSHIHSHWSPGYDRSTNPPTPMPGRDAIYPTPLNAKMARQFGLRWMVTTDHGGPNHSAQTFGGFDQMTAIVGGLWDALLGEGRRFWIVATSDSHVNYTEVSRSGSDFWPGQFHKTYVHARADYDDVLAGLRDGHIFAVAGDLITRLDVTADSSGRTASVGETLQVAARAAVKLTIRFRDPETQNHRGESPRVARVDVIAGDVRGPAPDRSADRNETTKVVARFLPASWKKQGDVYRIEMTLPAVSRPLYVRVRGTSSPDEEPPMDLIGENPWSDLWFYSNPVFISIR